MSGASGELIAGLTLARFVLFGSGNGVLPPGTKALDIEMVGGGGGGGGAQGGAGVGVGGGGGSGEYLLFTRFISGTNLAFVWSCGAPGAAGTNVGGGGGSGGSTVLTVDGGTYTARGATGGMGGLNTPVAASSVGGRPPAPIFPAERIAGTAGLHGVFAGGVFFSGAGGHNPLGAGGWDVDGATPGVTALGAGGGGSGGCATAAGQVGGGGGVGQIVLVARS